MDTVSIVTPQHRNLCCLSCYFQVSSLDLVKSCHLIPTSKYLRNQPTSYINLLGGFNLHLSADWSNPINIVEIKPSQGLGQSCGSLMPKYCGDSRLSTLKTSHHFQTIKKKGVKLTPYFRRPLGNGHLLSAKFAFKSFLLFHGHTKPIALETLQVAYHWKAFRKVMSQIQTTQGLREVTQVLIEATSKGQSL